MNININLSEQLLLKKGWPIFEVYDQNDNFINIIELIPDGYIGITRTDFLFRWCILGDHLCFFNNKNEVSMIGSLMDREKYIFIFHEILTKNLYLLKHIIS